VWLRLWAGTATAVRAEWLGGIGFADKKRSRALACAWADGLKERQLEEDVSALFCDKAAAHGRSFLRWCRSCGYIDVGAVPEEGRLLCFARFCRGGGVQSGVGRCGGVVGLREFVLFVAVGLWYNAACHGARCMENCGCESKPRV